MKENGIGYDKHASKVHTLKYNWVSSGNVC